VNIEINESLVRGTIKTGPMVLPTQVHNAALTSPSAAPPSNEYTISLDDGTTNYVKFEGLIEDSSTNNQPSPEVPASFTGLPHFLQLGSKVTMDHADAFHKGFLSYAKEGGYTFDVRRNSQSQKVEWQVPLPNFKQNWTNLVGEDVLIPGHSTVSSFLPSSTSNNTPSTDFVSAKNLFDQCPPSTVVSASPFKSRQTGMAGLLQ